MSAAERFAEAKHRALEAEWPSDLSFEKLGWTLSEPEFGWIGAVLRIGYDSFPISLSDVYPPFVEMLAWLEALIAGGGAEVLEIYDEAYFHYLHVERSSVDDACTLEYLATQYPVGGLYRRARVSFVALVREFHAGLEYLMSFDFEAEAEKEEGTTLWFNLDPVSSDIIRLDLSALRAFVATSRK